MNKLNLLLLTLTGLFLLFSCNDENQDKNCLDNEYYISFTANGKDFCFPNCDATLSSIPYGDSTKYYTSVGAGETLYEENDTTWLFPSIVFTFPDKEEGTFDNDDIGGLFSYYVQLSYDYGTFFYPSPFTESVSENFILKIDKYDLDNHVLTGTFNGIIFSTDETQSDSVIIENGIFKSQLYQYSK
ncbi:MAG: hypothetical protein A2X13_14240 [Bacteroidetes bacterium GWC2_33_15]|nr:MAG: hypothetical protein A2X10_12285 [Bacteroidetes bacterium GWA2_33_15]OFX50035.1 MAG: hypothetical protein A2X13_14240 [Bacteroidetes bacterium GWC2_33_15]OFX65189.1 MAG: hypothetical protein A2X15_03815 [Bacteroidetes bacterium GWB2_32_14]OFX70414.1 MAG: hypothetical protein A2X14_03870 [Bacteroidetes bacterium GWD2_33_33]HAN19718.1 hypothetical protein [Bacteroidales bacterium]